MLSRAVTLTTLALALAGAPVLAAAPAQAASADLVIAEVYGGGGNAGATYNADFVELQNLGTAAASLDGLPWTTAAPPAPPPRGRGLTAPSRPARATWCR